MTISDDRTATKRSAWGLSTGGGSAQWWHDALCLEVGSDLFFVDTGESTRPAKQVCSLCSVRAECLQDALDHDDRFGIRGGLSERQRRRLKRGVA